MACKGVAVSRNERFSAAADSAPSLALLLLSFRLEFESTFLPDTKSRWPGLVFRSNQLSHSEPVIVMVQYCIITK